MDDTPPKHHTLADVSVVMPVYNAASTLLRALESVAAQTTPPKEVICIDDASTDNSAALIHRFNAQKTFQIRYIPLPHNQGVASARNHGLDAATGQYIAFLDADDVWHPDKIALQLHAMDRLHLDLLGGHSEISSTQQPCPTPPTQPLATFNVQLMSAMLSNPWHTSSVMVRRNVCVHFSDSGHLSEDYGLWLRLLASKRRCARHLEPLSFMFKQAYGVSGLSAQLWRMQRGELVALSGIGAFSHPLKLGIAIPFSCLKFFWRLVQQHRKNRLTSGH
jgi:hypothetical protein